MPRRSRQDIETLIVAGTLATLAYDRLLKVPNLPPHIGTSLKDAIEAIGAEMQEKH